MNKPAAIKQFAKLIGIAIHQAARLVELCEEAERVQTDWHNGDNGQTEADADAACVAFEKAAAQLGFDIMWPGMFPVLMLDEQQFHMPDYDDEPLTVDVGDTRRDFSFPVLDMLQVVYYHVGEGRWIHEDTADKDWGDDDDEYTHRMDIVSDVIDNFLRHVPGLEEWDYYGDYTLRINLRELEEGGWDEGMLECYVASIANWIHEGQPLQAEGEPYSYKSRDSYGGEIWVLRYPDFLVPEHPNLEGWEFEYHGSKVRIGQDGQGPHDLPGDAGYGDPPV